LAPGYECGFLSRTKQMPTSSLTLPTDFNTNLLGQANLMLGNFAPYVELIVGVLLALVAIKFIIESFHK
jgi:hypothetical protein